MRQLIVPLIALLLPPADCFAPLGRRSPCNLRSHDHLRALPTLLTADNDESQERWHKAADMREVWQYREDFIKGSFRNIADLRT